MRKESKYEKIFNALSANPAKWSNTLKQFVDNLPTNCLSVFVHFMKLAFKGLNVFYRMGVVEKSEKSQGKCLCCSPASVTLACNFIKLELHHGHFPRNTPNFSRNSYFKKQL